MENALDWSFGYFFLDSDDTQQQNHPAQAGKLL